MLRRLDLIALTFVGSTLAACAGGEDMGDAQAGDMDVAASSELECYIARGTLEETRERPSPLEMTDFSAGASNGLLCYGAPSARERAVMGELVPWGQPWRIGANEPTTIHVDGPLSIGGVGLEAGSYSLYAIPSEGDWEFFVNPNWERWGIPIDESVRSTEIGSFTVTPEATDEMVETLVYRWEDGALVMEWENTRVRIPVSAAG